MAEKNANFVTAEQVTAAAEEAGLPPEQVTAITTVYTDAQIDALKASFAGIALFSLLALAYVRRLPTKEDILQAENKKEPAPQPA